MKLKRALIENFKGVKRCEIDFTTTTAPSPRFLTTIVGDNGSGKTTILQAIALTLSLATRRTRRAEELRWNGFLAERIGSLGPTRVELDVVFDEEELRRTSELHRQWQQVRGSPLTPEQVYNTIDLPHPSALEVVRLVYEKGHVRSADGDDALLQFLGRHYVRELLDTQPELRLGLRALGDAFWFAQDRSIGTSTLETLDPKETVTGNGHGGREDWPMVVERLRDDLVSWWAYHTSPHRHPANDFMTPLEEHFARVFPGTRFSGIIPRYASAATRRADFYFLIERDGRLFDIAELSSGEQAVFTLLYEFVRLDIARSVVLIDELELHLHPPQQQALLSALRKIGPECQFIFTTHSPYLSEVIPHEEIVRLEGGRPCL